MPTLLTSRYLEFMMRGGKRSECGYKSTGTHIMMAVAQKWKGDEKYSGWMASEKKSWSRMEPDVTETPQQEQYGSKVAEVLHQKVKPRTRYAHTV
jgi:hypothetical protein